MSTTATEAIRKTVVVDFAPAEAFELFTARIASWWPVGTHSYAGDEVQEVVLEPRVGGRLYERDGRGRAGLGPRARVGSAAAASSSTGTSARRAAREVEVTFEAEGPGSRVVLEHRGFGALDARGELRGRLGRRARALRRERVEEGLKPAQPLVPRHRGVRRRGRRQHPERRLGEAALLRAQLGPLAEGAAIGLLADEADRARPELDGDPLEARRRAGEVGAAKIARARRGARRRVRDADPEREQLELLRRLVEPRREAGGVEQAPEVVARVGEVRVGGRGDAAGIDPAEDRRQPGRRGRPGRRSQAASGVLESILSSKSTRRSSPETVVSKRGVRGVTFTTRTESSPPRQP